ncbi:MAG: protein translocase subunit SecD [Phycisphaeraceae bacterium]
MAPILFIILIAALFVGSAVLYAMNIHWWRVSLIAGVMFGAVALLWVPGDGDPRQDGFDGYGPADRLKPGIDLAGGTRLVYDVVVPEGQPKSQVIEDTIEILSDRVDPAGTRGLVWRTVAGQRIEVQMAAAPANVREKREAYTDAVKALRTNNISPGDLDAALAKGDPAELKRLAGEDASLLADLEKLQAAYDAREAARRAYLDASASWDETKQTIPVEQWDDHPAYKKLVELEREYNEQAKPDFEFLEQDILKANSFNIAEFERLEAIPPQQLTDKQREAGETTPRQDTLEALKKRYPNRAEAIQKAYDALVDYEAVKGPLDGPEDLIALLRGSGVLEFRITAEPGELNSLLNYMTQLDQQGPRARPTADYRWFEVDDLAQYVKDEDDRAKVEGWLAQSLSVNEVEQQEAKENVLSFFTGSGRVIARPYAGRLYVLLHNDEGMAMTRDDDWSVSGVNIGQDELGKPTVNYQLDGKGAALMRDLTGPNVGRPMAVLLDNKVLTDPVIRGQLSNQIQISGDFSRAEVEYLRDTMRAGSLEGQLSENPVSQLTIGPSLGADNVKAGLRAAVTAIILVAIFMTIYYFFAGLVANFALAANMVLILGVLALTQATFTLPGIAGLVLTIGMAVDANVLIFERIREEIMDRKVGVEVAARQGYGKALSTILDANITTLITCLILGYTATADVKGFAVVLGIGILATLFTALFCTKVFIDIYIRYRKPKTLEMLPTMVPAMHRLFSPNINWIGKAKYLVPISAILLVAGLGEAIFQRGEDMLDIEFRSGTSVGFELKPTGEAQANGDPVLTTLKIGEARDRIEDVAEVAKQVQAAVEAGEDFTPQSESDREIAAAVQEAYDRHKQAVAEYEATLASGGKVEKPDGVPDFALLDEVQVVTTGESDDPEVASGFSVATLITDSQAVTALLKVAFDDVLETTRPVKFKGEDLSAEQARGIVEPLATGTLGEAFEEQLPQGVAQTSLPDYVGGVAMYVQDMVPPLSVQELTERIDRMRRQPPHDELGVREFTVVGVERAAESFDDQGNPQYSSVVVAVHDSGSTDYSTTAGIESFTDTGGLADTEWKLLKDAMKRDSSFTNVTVFNSQVSGTMQQQAIVAIGLSLLAVVVYIWVRFGSIRYGLAAIAALVHDVSVALGLVALAGLAYNKLGEDSAIVQLLMLDPFKVNLAMIAAFLTIIGYSLNDTIVVFDRIRENRGRLSRATPEIINLSINQTISRTVLTSGTTFLAVATLYFIGGPGVHGFAFAMLLGVIVGTYSSIAIASPILLIGTKGKGPKGGPQQAEPASLKAEEPDIASEPATA